MSCFFSSFLRCISMPPRRCSVVCGVSLCACCSFLCFFPRVSPPPQRSALGFSGKTIVTEQSNGRDGCWASQLCTRKWGQSALGWREQCGKEERGQLCTERQATEQNVDIAEHSVMTRTHATTKQRVERTQPQGLCSESHAEGLPLPGPTLVTPGPAPLHQSGGSSCRAPAAARPPAAACPRHARQSCVKACGPHTGCPAQGRTFVTLGVAEQAH